MGHQRCVSSLAVCWNGAPCAGAGSKDEEKGRGYTNLFKNGKAAYVYDGMPAYLTTGSGYVDAMAAIDKTFDVRPMAPVGTDAVAWTDNASLQNCFVTKAGAERVKEILRLADFAASPFGSVEYTLINYGVEGTDSSGTPTAPPSSPSRAPRTSRCPGANWPRPPPPSSARRTPTPPDTSTRRTRRSSRS
ncbi:hypothetical protein ACGFYV_21005 [Streptomyces sp. NPDC048297]|uniref:hypothetical protein n=1 Tax=Streptomyces sp. NPDC048297 TaxID=3365531 RepID=UPI003720E8A2